MLAPLWGHFQSGANVLLCRMCRGVVVEKVV